MTIVVKNPANGKILGTLPAGTDVSKLPAYQTGELQYEVAQPAELVQYAKEKAAADAHARQLRAMEFGRNLMAEFGSGNASAGRPPEQVRAISSRLDELQSLLLSGSLKAALQVIDEIVADELIPEAAKAYFKARIEGFLATL